MKVVRKYERKTSSLKINSVEKEKSTSRNCSWSVNSCLVPLPKGKEINHFTISLIKCFCGFMSKRHGCLSLLGHFSTVARGRQWYIIRMPSLYVACKFLLCTNPRYGRLNMLQEQCRKRDWGMWGHRYLFWGCLLLSVCIGGNSCWTIYQWSWLFLDRPGLEITTWKILIVVSGCAIHTKPVNGLRA